MTLLKRFTASRLGIIQATYSLGYAYTTKAITDKIFKIWLHGFKPLAQPKSFYDVVPVKVHVFVTTTIDILYTIIFILYFFVL